ncbi:unnamed protein product [Blepharisma stoltei]|uniref:Protein kinase domain-containing protein n=1 Tax=Blepharisma stoltei TaxID=1481888 RepID=A0AAU9I5B5_9CILI|nr:unnamed protein product [Blepharisma stoltei]
MDTESRPVQITLFLNSDLTQQRDILVSQQMTVQDIIRDGKEAFNIDSSIKCKLYDTGGGELSDEDVEYINKEEPFFLSQGEKFSSETLFAIYKEIRTLGRGGFGTVKLYKHKLRDQEVAIKFIDMKRVASPEDVIRVFKEIQLLRDLRHPGIVQLVDAFPNNKHFCFVMEYCKGGELKRLVKENGRLPENEIMSIGLQMCDAMRYCHTNKVIHRDLKPENILFSDVSHEYIKIVDFGIAGIFTGQNGDRSQCGTLLYLAPEVISGLDNTSKPSLDIWSMGCIFYYLLTAQKPFTGNSKKDIIQNILQGKYTPMSEHADVSPHWHKLIRAMLRVDPKKRWTLLKVSDHLFKYKYSPDAPIEPDTEDEEEEKVKCSLLITPNAQGEGRTSRKENGRRSRAGSQLESNRSPMGRSPGRISRSPTSSARKSGRPAASPNTSPKKGIAE